MTQVRILIADDHQLVSDGIRRLLEPTHVVVGTVQDGAGVIPAIEALRPDLVLLDLSLPGRNGIEIARQIRDLDLGVRIIILTMHNDSIFALEAIRAGAAGFLLKQASGEELFRAIRGVMEGGTYLDEEMRRMAGM